MMDWSYCVLLQHTVSISPETRMHNLLIFFLTHYLVLSPGLLYVDTVILGLLLCLYIHTCSVL